MGFRRVTEYARCAAEGRTLSTYYRKNPPHTTAASHWYDLSIAGGFPRPNYYAASPRVAALLPGEDGMFYGYCGPLTDTSIEPKTRHLARWNVCSPTTGAVGPYVLMDYLLYYPFVDCDAVGEDQNMTNTQALTRYTSGEGVHVMAVCQAPTVGGGAFTFNYVDSRDVARTSPVISMGAAALNIGSLISCTPTAADTYDWKLPIGGSGIKRVTRVNVTIGGGGLMALVLVRPLAYNVLREVGSAREMEFVTQYAGAPRVFDGAFLNMIVCPSATLAGGVITGQTDFSWSA